MPLSHADNCRKNAKIRSDKADQNFVEWVENNRGVYTLHQLGGNIGAKERMIPALLEQGKLRKTMKGKRVAFEIVKK